MSSPDVFSPEFGPLKWDGLAYRDDLAQVQAGDWLCVGVALGTCSYR